MEEYASLYPQLVPISKRSYQNRQPIIDLLKERSPLFQNDDFQNPLKINAIFILGDCVRWEEHIQIICDLLSGPHGEIQNKFRLNQQDSDLIPIYWANNTLFYRDRNQLSRLGCGMFRIALQECFKLIYNRDLPNIQIFGKPHKESFDRAYEKAKALTDYEDRNIYMIGDSIYSDIKGAKALGWQTILIRSCLQRRIIDNAQEGSPANFVVRDFEEAIKLIFKKEGLIFNQPHTI